MKDRRYITLQKLFLAGRIESLREVLDTLPKTVLAKDLGMHHQTLAAMISNPQKFSYEIAFKIASLIDVEPHTIVNLIFNECLAAKAKKRKDKG